MPKTDAFGRFILSENLEEMTNEEFFTVCLTWLTPREEQILRMRWGIEEVCVYTNEEIAQRFAVTPARIEKMYHKAMGKVVATFLQYRAANLPLADALTMLAAICQRLQLR